MANLPRCKRCGKDIAPVPHSTNRRFCSRDCYDTWWSDFRTTGATVGDVVAKRDGPAVRMRLTAVQSSWLAALIDGEGTIGIYRIVSSSRKGGFVYRACVQVANTNQDLLLRMQELVPSGIHLGDRRVSERHKTIYRATVKSRWIKPLLEAIRLHLVAKGRQADNVIAFCNAKAGAPVRSSLDNEIFERLYQENKALNRRGGSTWQAISTE